SLVPGSSIICREGGGSVRLNFLDFADHAIAGSRHGLDKARTPGIIAQGLSDFGQALFQRVVGYGGACPNLFDQFVFGDDALAVFDEVNQDLKGLLAQMLLLAVVLQTDLRGVDLNALESIRSLTVRLHAPLSK